MEQTHDIRRVRKISQDCLGVSFTKEFLEFEGIQDGDLVKIFVKKQTEEK